MAFDSALGPTRRLEPVSRMASQPSVQVTSVSTPTAILFNGKKASAVLLQFLEHYVTNMATPSDDSYFLFVQFSNACIGASE